MKKNMGSVDKIVRILLVIAVGLLYYTKVIEGTLALVLGAFAVVLLLTSLISFCPLYLPFDISTKRK